MKTSVLAAVLIAAILVGAGIGYLEGTTATSPRTNTTTYTSTAVSTYTYLLTTGDATNQSQACIANLASPHQPQYMGTLLQIIRDPSFIEYSNGRCWTYDSTFVVSGVGPSLEYFVFDHYSAQIDYPCLNSPGYMIDARVYVVPSFSGDEVTGISIEPQSTDINYECPPGVIPDVGPQSFNFVSWNASGQTVALTLVYVWGSRLPLAGLQTKIYNSTWSYTVRFADVNSTDPLQLGSNATQVFLIPGSPLRANVIYDATAIFTYTNGTSATSGFGLELQM